ncbi:hypothetical protein N7509_001296 [Penicillium cosmopolitanum]|uniref:Xylanolytic transcriptional activator regulatory domain-containing protein n=1 Tax=Penicillium cosmopolitanum TaxID=1131564 RepID=A0A9W9WC08_9EURO|nr:uncharacterized protein N7509_001296 [Penicillium cosmopolitanum]KAJ5414669.1 hypothetical protein N7509_001296 [Penicillium cosmopolitanum]
MSLPSQSKFQVFTETYFMHLYHMAPVIDRADLAVEQPSDLLILAISLIGSQLRYPRDQPPTLLSESYYLKIKTLLYAKHEHDKLAILKTLCILCFWVITPPVVVSLDSSYHWLGVAVRLAYQMGLHRESSYLKLSNPGAARRLVWFIFCADKLQAAAFGRPIFISSQSINLRPLELEDFESPDAKAETFIQFTNLNKLLEKIVEFQDRRPRHLMNKCGLWILNSLKQWVATLPSNLNLHNDSGRREYCRGIAELHIHYFTCIILFIHLYGHVINPSMMTDTSLVASSCMARLYDEIDDHDEINYLTPVHNWSLMVGCIPQIHRLGDIGLLSEEHDLCNTELEIFVTALRCMRLKWPPANNILSTLDRLRTSKFHPMLPEDQSKVARPLVVLEGLFPFPRTCVPEWKW